MPLPLVPLESPSSVGAEMPLQVAVGEDGRATIELPDGQAAEKAHEQLLLDLVGRSAAGDRRPHEGGGEAHDGTQDGQRAAQAHQEGEHAAPGGQRAVEVEGGDGGATRRPLPVCDVVSRAQRHDGRHLPQIAVLPRASPRC